MTTMTSYLSIERTSQHKSLWISLAQIVAGSMFIALCAQIRVPLPFTPVPITGSTLGIMLVGMTLGSRNGALSALAYLIEAVFGLPVLSGLRIDPLVLFSPVGGYLVGFVFQAYIVGLFAETGCKKSTLGKFPGFVLASVVGMAFGAAWLGLYVGFTHVLLMGVIPFIPGELFKIVAALSIFSHEASRSE